MKKSKVTSVLVIVFTFIGSHLTLFMIYPSAYWENYFNLPFYRILLDALCSLLFCIVLLALSLFIERRLNKKIPWTRHPITRLLTQSLLQMLGALLILICAGAMYLLFADKVYLDTSPKVNVREGLSAIVSTILWAVIISGLNTGDFLLRNWKTATLKAAEFEIKAAQSKQLASEIELQALKLQLDPHFVFNNLSVLSELILKDQQLGHEYTENFAKVYRYLLVNSKKKLISLGEELRFLDAYLFLINNRMGGGSIFRINIDQSKLHMLIPPVTLQLFIENALKYNRTEEENPLEIRIYSNENDELVVSNNLLPLIKKNSSTGLGLKNIIGRYALLGDRIPVIIQNDESFTIKVPLIKCIQ